MKRFWLSVAVAGLFVANIASSQQRSMPHGFSKPQFSIPGLPQKRPESSENLFRMPSLTPIPNIDYKIQRMVVDESIDYKILDAAPRKVTADELRQRTRPPLFKFP